MFYYYKFIKILQTFDLIFFKFGGGCLWYSNGFTLLFIILFLLLPLPCPPAPKSSALYFCKSRMKFLDISTCFLWSEFWVLINNSKEAHVANVEWVKGHVVGNGKWNTTLIQHLQKPCEAQIMGTSHLISTIKPPYFKNNILLIKLKNNNTKKNLQYNLMKKHALKRLGRKENQV